MKPSDTEMKSLELESASHAERMSVTVDAEHALPAGVYRDGMAAPEFTRLVVLVPDRDVDDTAFARKVWALLGHRRVPVLFVTLVTNSDYGPGAQRRLITLAAITQDAFHEIETRLIFGRDWIPELAKLVGPGDLVVCHACQRTRSFLRQDLALADQIPTQLKAPAYVLDGLYQEVIAPRPSRFLRQVVFWGILVGILGGFFVFEADISHLAAGWISSLLLVLVFLIEIAFIWMWNFLRI